MAYVEIKREKLIAFLESCGFSPRRGGSELVYVRPHKMWGDVFVKVYTSLPAAGGNTRGKGQDAIRVATAYESEVPYGYRGKSFGIYKATRTFRTGQEEDVLDRLYHRMREAYQAGTDFIKENEQGLRRISKEASEGRGGRR
jgi:hypothetical protein